MSTETISAVICLIAGILLMVQSFSDFKVLSPKNAKMFKKVSQKSLRIYYGIFGILFVTFGVWALVV